MQRTSDETTLPQSHREIQRGGAAPPPAKEQRTLRSLGITLPATIGLVLAAALFWIGHLGVLEAARDQERLVEAEHAMAMAFVAGPGIVASAHMDHALDATREANQPELATHLEGAAPTGVVADDLTALAHAASLFDEARSDTAWDGEQRFLALNAAAVVLASVGVGLSLWLWWRRWQRRWQRVRQLNTTLQLIARAPLEPPQHPVIQQDELGHVERGVAWLSEQLADSMLHLQRLSNLGENVGYIAHDIRNPLTTIRLGLELAESGQLDAETRADLQREAERAIKLAEDLRSFARKDDGLELIELGGLVDEVARLSRAQLTQRQITLECEATPRVTVQARPNELKQVLVNLLDNAMDAAGNMPLRRIRVRVWASDGAAMIAVDDTGAGLPPGAEERVFEPYFTMKRDGSGMGLAICRHIVNVSGGELWAQPSELGGASFRVRLPTSEAPETLTASDRAEYPESRSVLNASHPGASSP